MKSFLLLLLPALFGAPSGGSHQLTITPIGHASVRVTDGSIVMLVDFPYGPGADFTPWKPEAIPQEPRALCVVTHAHPDHFVPELADRYCVALVAPKGSVVEGRLRSFGVEAGSAVEWKGITIQAIPTPHDGVEHYSYLVVWRGVRLFFSGDAETPDAALAVGPVDAAFLTPRLLMAVSKGGAALDAARVFSYHHRPDDPVPNVLGRIVSKPGRAVTIEAREP